MSAVTPLVGDAEPQERPSRNLVVCCDGTGNVWKPGTGQTNVVKLVQALVRDPHRQLHYYDPGVGTPDGYVSEDPRSPRDVVRRVAGLVWGDGVWANVAGAYSFLVQTYQPRDRIFIFGFSRGAFTARAVAGLVDLFGILRPEHDNLIPTLLETFRTKPTRRGFHAQDAGVATDDPAQLENPDEQQPRPREDVAFNLYQNFSYLDTDTNIHFIGVWDTVETVGLNQLAMGATITSDPTVKPSYVHVRHALALDERREPYSPRLYLPPGPLKTGRTYKQVWFAGCHSDVGGGYKEAGLANAAFHWMAREASHCDLLLDFSIVDLHVPNACDVLHDEITSNAGWTLAAVGRRMIPPGSALHESVFARAADPSCAYAAFPLGDATPEKTAVTVKTPDGKEEVRALPTPAPAVANEHAKEPPLAPRLTQGHILWLLTSLVATAGLFTWHHTDEHALALAQLDALRSGDFCAALIKHGFPAARAFDHLLFWDTVAILAYGSLLPVLGLFFFRFSDRAGAIPAWLGTSFQWCAVSLPLLDLLENFLSDRLLRHGYGESIECGRTVSHIASYVLGSVSVLKMAAVAGLALIVVVCAARGLRRYTSG